MKIVIVAGARPNFMKVAPIIDALAVAAASSPQLSYILVHTGQHYDEQMSRAFFDDLGLPRPDVDLGVGSGTHAEQTGRVLIAFEKLLLEDRPDWVVVVGDVNSTLACALAAKKLGIRVAHIEAGLRSRDWTMPEEINRVLTDALSDALFTTDPLADRNLIAEGIDRSRIHFVGNVMIDTLLKQYPRALAMKEWEKMGLEPGSYAVLTLHRPSNVDSEPTFGGIIDALEKIAERLTIVFPIHPRTRKMAEKFGLWGRLSNAPGIRVLEPLGYLRMLSLTSRARLILTDSGGLQEEAVALGVPCLTLRENTERPITVEVGANRVVGSNPEAICRAAFAALQNGSRPPKMPDKWDGKSAERIVRILCALAT